MMPTSEQIDAVIQSALPEADALLCELIAISSLPSHEAMVRRHLEEWAETSGIHWRRLPVLQNLMDDPAATSIPDHPGYTGIWNLVLEPECASEGRSLILNTHMDTVAGDTRVIRNGEWIQGRGACDAKGQIVTAMLVLLTLERLSVCLTGRLSVQCVVEEEAGGNGTLSLLRQGETADAAIVLEPTGLVMHPANRGAVWFRVETKGHAAHMGKWWDGVNAISDMRVVLNALQSFQSRLRDLFIDHPLFPYSPSPVVVNPGVIQGGDWPASVPDRCTLEGGVAFLPDWSCAQIIDEMTAHLRREVPEAIMQRVAVSAGRLRNEPYATPSDHPAVVCLQEAARGILPDRPLTGWIASCDARLFHHVGGMPVLTFGPGDLADAHSTRERIRMTDIATAARVLTRMAIRWCGVKEANS